jgi:SRSO17 transposase
MSVALETGLAPPPSGLPPTGNLAPRDVERLADALLAYQAEFAPLFRRAEQRHWALQYLQGQLLDLERKSIEPMALALADGDVQAMQQFISVGAWDDGALLERHQALVAESLGDPTTGVLIIDGCDFPKQGRESVGVAPQWCGALGKVANCQASVVACYASARGYTLVDRRLYLPERWFSEAYQERRQRCGVPADQQPRTEPELAAELITTLHRRGVLPFAWVTCDEHFGNNPALLDAVAAADVYYLAEVPHSTRVWRERPPTVVPPSRGRGRPPIRERVAPDAPAPVRVDHLVEQLAADQWTPAVIKEGAKGPLAAEFAFVRAVAVRDELPGPAVWVVLRRTRGETPELKTYLSNAPAETPHPTLVWVSGMRWPVESAILECKSELGMDHYEVRGWVGWHHHLALTFLAHHFLVRLRLELGEKITGAHRTPSARTAACGAAPPPARCRARHRPRPADPAAKLRGVLLPSPAHHPAARYLVSDVTL